MVALSHNHICLTEIMVVVLLTKDPSYKCFSRLSWSCCTTFNMPSTVHHNKAMLTLLWAFLTVDTLVSFCSWVYLILARFRSQIDTTCTLFLAASPGSPVFSVTSSQAIVSSASSFDNVSFMMGQSRRIALHIPPSCAGHNKMVTGGIQILQIWWLGNSFVCDQTCGSILTSLQFLICFIRWLEAIEKQVWKEFGKWARWKEQNKININNKIIYIGHIVKGTVLINNWWHDDRKVRWSEGKKEKARLTERQCLWCRWSLELCQSCGLWCNNSTI